MNKRSLIILALVLGIGLVVVLTTNFMATRNYAKNIPADEIPGGNTLVSFVSLETREALEVRFFGTVAILNGLNYENMVLTQAVSASGARYENVTEGLVLWNKGDEVTLEYNGAIIFTGTKSGAKNEDNAELPQSAEASPAEQLFGMWVWQRTELNDASVITPKKAEAFTASFSKDGRLSGTTDCNNFGGSYTVEGEVLSVGSLASTEMYCEGSQEAEFAGFFRSDTGVTFLFSENDELIINLPFDSGSVIFTRVLEEGM